MNAVKKRKEQTIKKLNESRLKHLNGYQQVNKQSNIIEIENQNTEQIKPIRRKYTKEDKIEIVQHAVKYSTQNASDIYCVPFDTIKKWRIKYNDNQTLEDLRKFNSPPIKYGDLQQEIIKEILRLRKLGLPVSLSKVINISKLFADQKGYLDFKGSKNWINNMFKRHNISFRRKTTNFIINQKEIEGRVIEFLKKSQENRYYQNYDIIINMDESPVFYSSNQLYTYDVAGSQRIPIRTSKLEKQKVTICLSVGIFNKNLQAVRFKPFIIFKNKSQNPRTIQPLKTTYQQQCYITFSKSGWQNANTMLEFAEFLVQQIKQILPVNERKSLLIFDQYKCHENSNVLQTLQKNNIDILVIPSGTTSLLQPLNVTIIRPFKAIMQNYYTEWQFQNEQNNNVDLLPSKKIFIDWILQSNSQIADSLILKSFQQTGITLQLDRLSVHSLSSAIKDICIKFMQQLNTYIQTQYESEQNNPYFDQYQVSLQDLFFNQILIEPMNEYTVVSRLLGSRNFGFSEIREMTKQKNSKNMIIQNILFL